MNLPHAAVLLPVLLPCVLLQMMAAAERAGLITPQFMSALATTLGTGLSSTMVVGGGHTILVRGTALCAAELTVTVGCCCSQMSCQVADKELYPDLQRAVCCPANCANQPRLTLQRCLCRRLASLLACSRLQSRPASPSGEALQQLTPCLTAMVRGEASPGARQSCCWRRSND
jgi:hypothetical protein